MGTEIKLVAPNRSSELTVRGSEIRSAYLAHRGLDDPLLREIPQVLGWLGDLLLSSAAPVSSRWALNTWLSPQLIPCSSIKDAARALTAVQRSWWPYICRHPRRAKLIQAALPHVSGRPAVFLSPTPNTPLGSWTLLDPELILASAPCSSFRPNGGWEFVEDKVSPPNRAYLKLWEVFTRLGVRPGPGDFCVDAGASPGGWTWVLSRLGATVLACDRSDLVPGIQRLPGVTFCQGDAFKIGPGTHPEITWVFSDVICYPERLFSWVQAWLGDAKLRNFVCTVKFQGSEHYSWIERFAQIKGSRLVHLYHNKHELTFVLLAGLSSEPRSHEL